MAWTFYDNNGTLLQGVADNAVTAAKIADDAVNSEHYVNGSIDTAHIGNLQVTGALIAANTITGDKIALGSDAAGDIMYYNGTDYVRLAKPGTPAGEALTFAASATAPSWVAASAGVSLGLTIALGG